MLQIKIKYQKKLIDKNTEDFKGKLLTSAEKSCGTK